MGENILEIKNLNLFFKKGESKNQILFDVNVSLKKGEVLGLIGESGSGKTQMSLSILRLSDENSLCDGEILYKGKNILKMSEDEINKIRGNDISIAFQDATTSLNPYIKIKDQAIEQLMIHKKKTQQEAEKEIIDIFKFLQIPNIEKKINCYPHEFSGGQRQRILIGMAISCNPEIFIADELTTSLDVITQKQVLLFLKEIQKKRGMSIIFISHDLRLLSNFVDKVAVIYRGHIVEEAEVNALFENPMHPYSQELINIMGEENKCKKTEIKDEKYCYGDKKEGCPYASRCCFATEQCFKKMPVVKIINGHKIACFKY